MELQELLPCVDDAIAELIDYKRGTNYLHLLPQEVLAKHLLPCITNPHTSGVLVGLLAGKWASNEQFGPRIEVIDHEDAQRLTRIPRLNGLSLGIEKKNDLDLMALHAIETDNYSELDFFIFKNRRLLIREMKQAPLKSLAHERRLSQTMQKMVDEKKVCCPRLTCSHSHWTGKLMNGAISILPLYLAGAWALDTWPTQATFEVCQEKHWDSPMISSYETNYPCNATQMHGDIRDCLKKVTTEICNGYKHQQIFINFLPLITAAFIVAGIQGVLLVLKKCCYAPPPLSQDTQELVILYDQLISQTQEGMLPDAEEV